jgi:hypothetical protein
MIIDTYVYFVSYQWNPKGNANFGFGNSEVTVKSKIKGIDDILHVSGLIKDTDNDIGNVVILSFQLLDSYNKEEREAKENDKKSN